MHSYCPKCDIYPPRAEIKEGLCPQCGGYLVVEDDEWKNRSIESDSDDEVSRDDDRYSDIENL